MGIRVLRPGLLTSVQDLGRWGWQRYGVIVSGAMDRRSLRTANLLVGNEEHLAALEMTLMGPSLHFAQETLIAICGGEMNFTVDGQPISLRRPVYVPPDTKLVGGATTRGSRAYLAVAGGFDVPAVLDSRSTYLAAGIGGLAGRALQPGDILTTGAIEPPLDRAMNELKKSSHNSSPVSPAWYAASSLAPDPMSIVLRIIVGGQLDWLRPESQTELFESEFEVTSKSDRMGYRLAGPVLTLDRSEELVSEGVAMGTVQVPPNGQPIVLMADCATTGGYPKVAHVASVDLPLLAQATPGAKIRWRKISVEKSQDLYRASEAYMKKLRLGIALKFAQLESNHAH